MVLVQMNERGTVTIPRQLRRRGPPGDLFEVVLRDDGVYELRPQVPVDASQAWFWSKRWQEMEREVDEEIAKGRVRTFDDLDSFFADLDSNASGE